MDLSKLLYGFTVRERPKYDAKTTHLGLPLSKEDRGPIKPLVFSSICNFWCRQTLPASWLENSHSDVY